MIHSKSLTDVEDYLIHEFGPRPVLEMNLEIHGLSALFRLQPVTKDIYQFTINFPRIAHRLVHDSLVCLPEWCLLCACLDGLCIPNVKG